VFGWQLFQNKITSKDNLLKRGIFSGDTTLCVSGCEECENVTTYYLNAPSFLQFGGGFICGLV